MKNSEVEFPKFPLKQVANRIMTLRKITRVEQQLLMNATLSENTFVTEDKILIDKIYNDVRRGWIKVV